MTKSNDNFRGAPATASGAPERSGAGQTRMPLLRHILAGLWFVVTVIAAFSGGLRSPVVVIYPILVVATGWLDSARSAKLMAGLTMASSLALWLSEPLQWLPGQFTPPTAVYAIHQIIMALLSAALIVLVLRVFGLRLEQLHETKNTLKKQALALQQSEERYRTLIESSPEAILVHREGKIIYANPAVIRLFGAPDAARLLATRTADLIHPDNRAIQAARMKSIIKQEAIPPATESRFLKLDGTVIDVQVQGTAIDYDGAPAIQVSIHDITERKRLEDEIRQLAFYDVLTHLPNRRLLDDRLRQVLSTSKRHGGYSALMFLDLDNFKALNDSHGHALGDALLIDAAARLSKCVRAMDTVARFGGDEFVVLLSALSDLQTESTEQALGIAEKIRAVLSVPYQLNTVQAAHADSKITHQCTVSVGVVVFSSEQTRQQDLLKWADAAMYQAKEAGRNRVHLFRETSADE